MNRQYKYELKDQLRLDVFCERDNYPYSSLSEISHKYGLDFDRMSDSQFSEIIRVLASPEVSKLYLSRLRSIS